MNRVELCPHVTLELYDETRWMVRIRAVVKDTEKPVWVSDTIARENDYRPFPVWGKWNRVLIYVPPGDPYVELTMARGTEIPVRCLNCGRTWKVRVESGQIVATEVEDVR